MRRKAGISIWQSLHLDLSFSGVTDSSPRNGKPGFHKETDDSYSVIIALVYLFIVVFRTDPALGTEAVLSSVLMRVRKYNSLYLSPRQPPTHPHERNRLLLDGCLWNLLFEDFFLRFVGKFQVSLKSYTNNWHFTWRPKCFYDNSLISPQTEKCLRQNL